MTEKPRQIYLLVMAIVAWLAVLWQIFLTVTRYNAERSLIYVLVDAVRYFTVLTNIL